METTEERFVRLETRLSYLEASLDELTRDSLQQRELLRVLSSEMEQLKSLVRDLTPDAVMPPEQEPPPPHY